MLHDQDAARKIYWQMRKQVLQRARTTRGNANGDDVGRCQGLEFAGPPPRCVPQQELRLHARALRRGLDLPDQFVGNFGHARRHILRFGHEIECAQRQCLKRDRRPGGRMRADDDDRQLPVPHDLL